MKHNSEDRRPKKDQPAPTEKPREATGNGHEGENGHSAATNEHRPRIKAKRAQPAHQPSALEEAKAKLRAAGLLATEFAIPDDALVVSDEELEQLGQMTPGARPSEELVSDDRGTD
jgi:hypothetical protein